MVIFVGIPNLQTIQKSIALFLAAKKRSCYLAKTRLTDLFLYKISNREAKQLCIEKKLM
jgi:hypothetical protein